MVSSECTSHVFVLALLYGIAASLSSLSMLLSVGSARSLSTAVMYNSQNGHHVVYAPTAPGRYCYYSALVSAPTQHSFCCRGVFILYGSYTSNSISILSYKLATKMHAYLYRYGQLSIVRCVTALACFDIRFEFV